VKNVERQNGKKVERVKVKMVQVQLVERLGADLRQDAKEWAVAQVLNPAQIHECSRDLFFQ
jgi:hypothetical protein